MYFLVAETNPKLQYEISSGYLLVLVLLWTTNDISLYNSYTGLIYLVFLIFKMHTYMHKTSVIYTASSLASLRKSEPTQTWNDHD